MNHLARPLTLVCILVSPALAFDASPTVDAPNVDGPTIQGSGPTGDVSGMTSTTRAPTDSTTSLATTAFVQAVKGVRAFAPGTGVAPFVENPVFVTATYAAGSPTITVVSAAGLRVGMSVWSKPPFEYGSTIAAISGTAVTIATADGRGAFLSGTGTLQFGQNRWDQTSNLITNTVGARKMWVGAAALGGNSLPDWIAGGFEVPENISLVSITPNGTNALLTAMRTGDNPTGAYGVSITNNTFTRNDGKMPGKNYVGWGHYYDTRVPADARAIQTLAIENSLDNLGMEAKVDPYTYNTYGMTANLRLNSGVGEHDAKAVSAAMDIGNNRGRYLGGINILNDAFKLQPGQSYGDAIMMGQGSALSWYHSAGHRAWQMVSTAAGGPVRYLTLTDDAIRSTENVLVGSSNNSMGVDKVIAVNGPTSSGIATQTGGTQAVGLSSAAGYSALVDSRAADFHLGTNSAFQVTLRANGAVRFRPRPSLPANPAEGDCAWDGVAHKLKCFDGTVWHSAW